VDHPQTQADADGKRRIAAYINTMPEMRGKGAVSSGRHAGRSSLSQKRDNPGAIMDREPPHDSLPAVETRH
jgi:hypothetical protein